MESYLFTALVFWTLLVSITFNFTVNHHNDDVTLIMYSLQQVV